MRILADENVDRPIARWLAEQGHDVMEASVSMREAADSDLIDFSRREHRILISFDRDIGNLMQLDSAPHPGVVYLRLRGKGPELWRAFQRVWPRIETLVTNHFVTVRNDRIRRRPIPLGGAKDAGSARPGGRDRDY